MRASFTRSPFSRRCPRPASARCSRSKWAGAGLDIIGVIGIVLLIGIVKKNAIMMIDFALEAQRVEGLNARDAIFQACLLRLRPNSDDDGGGDVRRAAADAGHAASARSCATRWASRSSAASRSARC